MLLDLKQILASHHIQPRGVIQVGAHSGQEISTFVDLGIPYGLFFECLPSILPELQQVVASRMPGGKVIPCAVGDKPGTATLHVEQHPKNRGMSSSCLTPKLHTSMSPDVVFTHTLEVPQVTLDQALDGDDRDYDLLVMDVQGYEGKVLDGARKLLESRKLRCVLTEVNMEELYEGCIRLEEMDSRMWAAGLRRVAIHKAHRWWGDAAYVCASGS